MSEKELINEEISNMLKNDIETDAVGEYAEFYLDDIRDLLHTIRTLRWMIGTIREREANGFDNNGNPIRYDVG